MQSSPKDPRSGLRMLDHPVFRLMVLGLLLVLRQPQAGQASCPRDGDPSAGEAALLMGRCFSPEDTADAPGVAIVNEALAHHLWPGADPLGKLLSVSLEDGRPRRVVGLVRDPGPPSLLAGPRPQVYLPDLQTPAALAHRLAGGAGLSMHGTSVSALPAPADGCHHRRAEPRPEPMPRTEGPPSSLAVLSARISGLLPERRISLPLLGILAIVAASAATLPCQ